MNPQEVLELVRAGYTKAEINALYGMGAQQEQQDQQEQPEQPEQDQQEQQEPPLQERLNKMAEALDKLTRSMQAAAVRQSEQPKTQERTPEQVLQDIANMYK